MLRLQQRRQRANCKLLLNRTAADCELNRRAKSFWMSAILAFLDNSTQHVCLWRQWKSNQPWNTPGEQAAARPADCDDFYISVTVRVFSLLISEADIQYVYIYIYINNIQITKESWGKLSSHFPPRESNKPDLNLTGVLFFLQTHVHCRWPKSNIHIWFYAGHLKMIWKAKKT